MQCSGMFPHSFFNSIDIAVEKRKRNWKLYRIQCLALWFYSCFLLFSFKLLVKTALQPTNIICYRFTKLFSVPINTFISCKCVIKPNWLHWTQETLWIRKLHNHIHKWYNPFRPERGLSFRSLCRKRKDRVSPKGRLKLYCSADLNQELSHIIE